MNNIDENGRFEEPIHLGGAGTGTMNTFNGLPMVEAPDDDRTGGEFAAELGKFLAHAPIYRRQKIVVTLNAKGDRLEPVGEHELRTLIEKYVCLYRVRASKKAGEQLLRTRITLGVDAARMVLSSPQFLQEIREVEHLHDVPLPVLRADGRIELLPVGYDASSRILTIRGCDYTAQACADGGKFLRELMAEFQFTDAERDLAVAVTAALTLYARRLLPTLAHRPAFIYTANAPGSGKTLLADCAIAPILGRSPHVALPRREEEIEKLITAEMIAGSECVLFDNVKGRVDSPALEGLLSLHDYRGRILNQSKTYEGENHLVVFMTGNGVTVSEDMARRALFVELFQPQARAQDRQFRQNLSVAVLIERRREILAALWQMVQAWDAAGRPRGKVTHASFPELSAIIGGIAEHAGFVSPFTKPQLQNAGNPDTDDMELLVSTLWQRHRDLPITFEELAEIAAAEGLFERITGLCTAAGMDRRDKSSFGKLLVSFDRRVFGEERATFRVEGRGHSRRFRVVRPAPASSADATSTG